MRRLESDHRTVGGRHSDGTTAVGADRDRHGTDQLYLWNKSKRPIIVLGYEGEPYLRITSEAVFENRNSPAAYLNKERFGGTSLPKSASPKAVPRWVRIETIPVAQWHDHRIHWMSKTPPPKVRANPDEAQHVFDWAVPIRSGEGAHKITGSLDYAPPDSQRTSRTKVWIGLGGLALVFVAGGSGWFRRGRLAGRR